MSIKSSFSIKDLENLSGVKAHTIRIWEKRHKLLEPIRTDTNIRLYDHDNLRKILNVALLNDHGIKVSNIAILSEEELYSKVQEIAIDTDATDHALNSFKLSMLNFDTHLFNSTYNQLQAQKSFREIFLQIFLKLLEQVGFLWLTKTITPAHEHFLFMLIKQKLLINIERVQANTTTDAKKTYVLFLPINEIHELGLLYIHFELLLKGYKSIYLGPSVPIDDLEALQHTFKEIEFISYFTIEPAADNAEKYLEELHEKILKVRNENVHVIGRSANRLEDKMKPNVRVHDSIIKLLEKI